MNIEQEEWEKEFIERFSLPHWEATGGNLKYVQDFIRSLLEKRGTETIGEATTRNRKWFEEGHAAAYKEIAERCCDKCKEMLRTPEMRRKISEGRKRRMTELGYINSAETRQRMSEAAKRRYSLLTPNNHEKNK